MEGMEGIKKTNKEDNQDWLRPAPQGYMMLYYKHFHCGQQLEV